MRSAVLTYIGSLFCLMLVLTLSSITMKASYSESIRQNLDDAILFSVGMLQQDRMLMYDTSNNQTIVEIGSSEEDKFKEDFVYYLTKNLDTKVTDIEVDIYGVDTTVGALSVEVRATFDYPNGIQDTVSSYKTVILNKHVK